MENQDLTPQELSSILTRFKESDFLFYILVLMGVVYGSLILFLRIFHRARKEEHNITSPLLRILCGTSVLTFMFTVIGIVLLHAQHVFMDDHVHLFQMSSLTWTQSATYYKSYILPIFIVSLIWALIITLWVNDKIQPLPPRKKSIPLRYVPPNVLRKHIRLMYSDSDNNDDDDNDPCASHDMD